MKVNPDSWGDEGNDASRMIVACYHQMFSNADLNTRSNVGIGSGRVVIHPSPSCASQSPPQHFTWPSGSVWIFVFEADRYLCILF